MTWVNEDGTHEGWTAPLFADGAIGSGWLDNGVLVARLGDGTKLDVDAWQSRPESDISGWVAVCECGWRGTPASRVATPDEHDPTRRRIFSEDSDLDGHTERALDVHAAWTAHLAPFDRLSDVGEAARQHHEAARQLDEAVRAANVAGASWDDIARVAGISRQAAQERWAARA